MQTIHNCNNYYVCVCYNKHFKSYQARVQYEKHSVKIKKETVLWLQSCTLNELYRKRQSWQKS